MDTPGGSGFAARGVRGPDGAALERGGGGGVAVGPKEY